MPQIEAWVVGGPKGTMGRREVDLPPLGAEEVEIEVKDCGPCHSDLSIRDGTTVGAAIPTDPPGWLGSRQR